VMLPPMIPAQLGVQVTEAMPPPIVRELANAGDAIAANAIAAAPIDFNMDISPPVTQPATLPMIFFTAF